MSSRLSRLPINLVKGAGDVQIVTGKESGNISRRPNPVKGWLVATGGAASCWPERWEAVAELAPVG